MSFLDSDYVNITAVNQFDTPIRMPKDSKPSTEAYNLGIFQRIANSLLWLKEQLENAVVRKTGDHTMIGHLSIPAPTSDAHAATKKYVDDTLGGISGTPGDPGGPPAGSAASGYVKHLSGLMEAWVLSDFHFAETAQTYELTLPIEFATVLSVQITSQPQTLDSLADSMFQLGSYTTSTVTVFFNDLNDGDTIAQRAWVRVLGTWN